MTDYIILEIVGYKKMNEYNKYKMKRFKMKDKLKIGDNIELIFSEKDKLKAKFESVIKTNDKDKIFFLNTNKFCASIQVEEFYEQTND